MSIKEFAEKFINAQTEAWENGNFDKLEAIEHKDVIYHIPGMTNTVGIEGQKQHIQGMRQIFSDREQQFDYLVGDVNVFSVGFKIRAKLTADHLRLPIPAGKTLNANAIFVCQVKDGKVAEVWMNENMKVE